MDDHGSSHPLLQSPAATTLAYAWGYQQHPTSAPFDEHHPQLADTGAAGDHHQQLDAPELRRALVRALAELHASRAAHQAELRRVESEAARLAALVSSAAAERDELRRHCHSLLLLLHHQAQAQPPPPHTPSLHAASVLSAGGGGGGGCTNAAAVMMNNENAPDAAAACADETTTELEMALARRLPEKGRLVEAVVSAGPLLQTLLLAGPLPRWRHPPPPAPADIPPFNPGRHSSPLMADASNNSFSSASAGSSSPESNCSGGGPPPPPPVAHALPSFHMSPFCM
ncbi:hypothetical protein BDA96_06G015800 [Sorghum bicolor]|uniref:Uncharacterized protein n=2 Tax=Sorghum bicolor TaxID=4558 RepID=A0A921QMV8_SORBI|nr:uncharacterized protein LOC8065997 [Sorghum bicolor]EES11787.1 hypothetical protein SORBI_3006G014500 [Sorghum bicolor]KAG0524978.1 hypothetical protein BDA96_06G015800 [Sorghum bicolor]|eukprot:XP_002447459.1 uncharacterized protein LOC8065997 [Sorghum bicolor]